MLGLCLLYTRRLSYTLGYERKENILVTIFRDFRHSIPHYRMCLRYRRSLCIRVCFWYGSQGLRYRIYFRIWHRLRCHFLFLIENRNLINTCYKKAFMPARGAQESCLTRRCTRPLTVSEPETIESKNQ